MEEEEKIISAPTQEALWQTVIADFKADPAPMEYHVVLEQQERRVILDIFNNHAVGFEAMAYTSFTSYLYSRDAFRFSVHKQGFTDEIGKIFGMQDIVLGFKDFDEKFVIKSNDENKAAALFSDASIREALLFSPNLSFEIIEYTLEDGDGKAPFLELKIERAINDPSLLQKIYTAYFKVLQMVEK